MSYKFDANETERLMRESRDDTRRLFSLVISEADLRRPPSAGFRPLLWHLGHVGAFEEYWLLCRVKGNPPISSRYADIFDPIKTPREDSTNLPPIAEIESYLSRVREEVFSLLGRIQPGEKDPLLSNGYVFDLVIEHEYQHQETLAYLLQMLEPELKRRPDPFERESDTSHAPRARPLNDEMVRIEGGFFEMGSIGYPFAYDNEQPPHAAFTGDFRIDRYPVTNAAFAEFIGAGGYHMRSLWSEEGWAWKEANEVERPLYWVPSNEPGSAAATRWGVQEMFDFASMRADHPVTGVSWHEAEAYARFAGKRLPTEAEWEKAASWDPRAASKRRFSWGDEYARPDLANFDNHHWGTTPVDAFESGQSAYGCFDMTGNVWEWTSTVFGPFEGFRAFPYPEYSELWFDGDHRVLKGGSWTTRAPLLRCSFRNFFRPRFRAAFAGFRCAAD
jgi:ergothioneine biosynthesis protein EgtB